MFFLKKYCANVENCGSFKGFGFLYKYIDDVGLFVLSGNVFFKS